MRLLFFLLLSAGCATIKPTQMHNVKAFATTTKALSAVPGELYQQLSNYRHQLKLIEVSSIYTSDKIVPRLNRLLEMKAQFDQNATQIRRSALVIESYAECLLALTDEGHKMNLDSQSSNLSLKLHAAIRSYNQSFSKPLSVNIGSFIGAVVTKVGSMKLHQLQRQYLKPFVDTGSLVINDVCDYFTGTVAQSLDNELGTLDKQFENVMTTFYDNVYEYQKGRNVNPFDYLRDYNPMYLEMKAKLGVLHSLQQKTIAAMQRIKETHEKLRLSLSEPARPGLMEEIKELYAIATELQATYRNLNETR